MNIQNRPSIESFLSLANHEVYLITACDGERENGQIATWILPATLASDTTRILAVLSPNNHTHDLIAKSRRFVVHLLAEEQFGLLPLFGLTSGRSVNKFDGMTLLRTGSGLPVIPNTCGWAECVIVSAMDGGDRIIYLSDVIEQFNETFRRPLRKKEAFERLPDEVRMKLEEKALKDGLRDAEILRLFKQETAFTNG